MENTNKLPPYPSGWFAVAFSKELKKGKVLRKTFMGEELVLFRNNEGKASALDAYCPHLGAHMGYGGKVVNGCIQCPFHHLKFNTEGQCTDHKHIKTKTWLLEERDGFIWLYHGNREKMHELPHLEKEGWKPQNYFSMKLKSHPQETTENFVDLSHFSAVHNLPQPTFNIISSDDNVFVMNYTHTETTHTFFKWLKTPLAYATFYLFGTGYALTEITFPRLNIKIAILSLSSPIDKDHLILRLSSFTSSSTLKQTLLTSLMTYFTFKQVCRFIKQDALVWNHRKHIEHPILQTNEKLIIAYRKWIKRFYE